jgi:aspartokinase/homoserine dehydrogenase 1
VILGREMGLELELSDLHIEGLVPAELEQGDVESFLAGLARYDQSMCDRYAAAAAKGCVLRFTGTLAQAGVARVELVELPNDHAFAHANLTDNVVQFATERYCDNPLVVQGPGAGLEVTAAGVFADLLRLCDEKGARLQ